MNRVSAPSMLDNLARTWRMALGSAQKRALLALLICVLVCGAHLARAGTPVARSVTGAALVIALLLLCAILLSERRRWHSPRRVIHAVLSPTDRALAERSLRALTLVERTATDQTLGSSSLAALHFDRLIARASIDAVRRTAARRATRWRVLSLVLSLAAVFAIGIGPLRVVEGLDVLFAHDGSAPLPLRWLDYVRISSQPPHYLRQTERSLYPGLISEEPAGSVLTVRGVPRRDGRHIVLSDGEREVPFVSDGSGGMVARFTLDKTLRLRIAARFGQVLIPEPETLDVAKATDRAPVVQLEGAPRAVEWKRVRRLEIRYTAEDDHGLTEVDLVLRAGDREDRRVLAKLDDEATLDRGGHAIDSRDPFLRRMFLPVHVTVEARDNDPFGGPKWGKSPAIVIVPPAVGEPEAERYAAIATARAEITDLLAAQVSLAHAERAKQKLELAKLERERTARATIGLRRAIDGTFSGLALPGGLRAFLAGQARQLESSVRRGASKLRKTEDVLLAVDVALRGLSSRDARAVAQRLADVADEAADGAKQVRETERRDTGLQRLDAAMQALDAGARQLLRLGMLGRDLGSVALADLGRVRRARGRDDLMHAELAARHLAERLRRPNPSFGSAGRGRPGGVESGASGGAPAPAEASQADDRFNQLASELAELVSEHADSINHVERSLGDAEKAVDVEHLRDEAKRRADAIRRAVADLPQLGADPGSARGTAALGREHAGAMAQNLERLALSDAVQSGRNAESALKEARTKAQGGAGPSDWLDEAALESAEKRLAQELSWAEQKLQELRQSSEARVRGTLNQAGTREQDFARRAGNLAGRGKHGETALPEDVLRNLELAESAMQDAARELSNGKGENGLALQRTAQRLIEQASTGKTTDRDEGPSEPQERPEQSGRGIRTEGDVPDKSSAEDAEDFRRRVLQGLRRDAAGRLSPAVKRYAEGLLR